MSADIIILPSVRVEEGNATPPVTLQVKLPRKDYARLLHWAAHYNETAERKISDCEAVAAIVSEYLKPRKRSIKRTHPARIIGNGEGV